MGEKLEKRVSAPVCRKISSFQKDGREQKLYPVKFSLNEGELDCFMIRAIYM